MKASTIISKTATPAAFTTKTHAPKTATKCRKRAFPFTVAILSAFASFTPDVHAGRNETILDGMIQFNFYGNSASGAFPTNKATANDNIIVLGDDTNGPKFTSENPIIYGGYTHDIPYYMHQARGPAERNELTINKGTKFLEKDVKIRIYGGVGTHGNATQNKVYMNGVTIVDSGRVEKICGGMASDTGSAISNALFINLETDYLEKCRFYKYVFGGEVNDNGNAENNVVEISVTGDNGAPWFANISGGFVSGKGDATNNTVEIKRGIRGTNIENVFGGYTNKGNATGNIVIFGNEYTGETGIVNGGKTLDGDATNNTVIIKNGGFPGSIYGGNSDKGSADNNSVIITGGEFKAEIYGGYGKTSAINNSVTIGGSSEFNNLSRIYGGFSESGDSFSGNTLIRQNANHALPTGNPDRGNYGVSNFEFIKFDYSGDAQIGSLDTTVRGAANDKLVKIEVSGTGDFSTPNSISFGGLIGGSGGIEKTGNGTLILAKENTYTGATTIASGTLSIASDNNIGKGTNTLANGTLLLTGNEYHKDWKLDGIRPEVNTASNDVFFHGKLAFDSGNEGQLHKSGSGNLHLSNTNNENIKTFLIHEGTVTAEAAGTLPVSEYIFDLRTVLDLNNFDQTVAALNHYIFEIGGPQSTAEIRLGSATLTIKSNDPSNKRTYFAGEISGSGNLTIDGQTSVTLCGTNTYTGTTTVKSGELILDGVFLDANASIASTSLVLHDDTAFTIKRNAGTPTFKNLEIHGSAKFDGNLNIQNTDSTISFYVPQNTLHPAAENAADQNSRATLLNVTKNAEISGADIFIALEGSGSPLAAGDTITLIHTEGTLASDHNGKTALTNTSVTGMSGISIIYDFDLSTNDHNLYATVHDNTPKPPPVTPKPPPVTPDPPPVTPEPPPVTPEPPPVTPTPPPIIVEPPPVTPEPPPVTPEPPPVTPEPPPPTEPPVTPEPPPTVEPPTTPTEPPTTEPPAPPPPVEPPTPPAGRLHPQTKAILESRLAAVSDINQTADLVIAQITSISKQTNTSHAATGNVSTFAASSGGDSRYATGSHVNLHGTNALVGFATTHAFDSTKLTLGGFSEYGMASYDSLNSFYFNNANRTVRGSGNLAHYGAGIFARLDSKPATLKANTCNADAHAPAILGSWHLETSAHAGRLENTDTLRGLDGINGQGTTSAKFTTKPFWVSAHIGTGYEITFAEPHQLDLSARLLWAFQGNDTLNLSTGDHVHFNSVNSLRSQIAARYTFTINETLALHSGLAYEHEFDGRASGTTAGRHIATPTLRGSTALGELGFTLHPFASHADLLLDLTATAYLGSRTGYSALASIHYKF